LCEFFALRRMHAAVITVQTVLTDRLHIVMDYLIIYFGIISKLHRLIQKLFQPSLLFQPAVYLFPCTILAAVHFAFSVFSAAALPVHQTLGTVNHRTDTACYIQK